MQISEDWILNHDDIEDGSDQRRGKPALYKIYGKELALNAGDGLHVLMWKMLLDNLKIVGEEKGQQIMDEFYQMLNRTVLGQTVENKWAREKKTDLTDKDILFILESKTGYYTIGGPMRLGAILAGASNKELTELYEFGKILGRSFQIIDDLLDLTSDFKGQKKQPGNDVYEGKRTIMLVHLFRTLNGEDKKKLVSIMEKTREEKTENEIKWVIDQMKKQGSLNHGKKLAEKYAKEAQDIFEKKLGFLKKEPARSQIRLGIDFIVKREY
jgi:geranylgeranyl diphosphate synthase type II